MGGVAKGKEQLRARMIGVNAQRAAVRAEQPFSKSIHLVEGRAGDAARRPTPHGPLFYVRRVSRWGEYRLRMVVPGATGTRSGEGVERDVGDMLERDKGRGFNEVAQALEAARPRAVRCGRTPTAWARNGAFFGGAPAIRADGTRALVVGFSAAKASEGRPFVAVTDKGRCERLSLAEWLDHFDAIKPSSGNSAIRNPGLGGRVVCFDLFCGSGKAANALARAMRERGHANVVVFALDFEDKNFRRFRHDRDVQFLTLDALDFDPLRLLREGDVVLAIVATPPCTTYSNAHTVTARIHERVRVSDLLVEWTTSVVRRAAARQPFPPSAVLESSRGTCPWKALHLRRQNLRDYPHLEAFADAFPAEQGVSQCKYGRPYRKDTTLFSSWPLTDLRPMCGPSSKGMRRCRYCAQHGRHRGTVGAAGARKRNVQILPPELLRALARMSLDNAEQLRLLASSRPPAPVDDAHA